MTISEGGLGGLGGWGWGGEEVRMGGYKGVWGVWV